MLDVTAKICGLFLFGILLVWTPVVAAAEQGPALAAGLDDARLDHRAAAHTTLIGIGLVTVWGLVKWDYFSRTPTIAAEGWFAEDTDSGGLDKLGHLYSSYVMTRGLSAYYRHLGLTEEQSARYGALSALGIMAYVEFGDSFSDYGFSYEDLLANSLGVLIGYGLERDKRLAQCIDLRWEYGLEPNSADIFTDYENAKYLVAVKLDGFERFRDSRFRFLELHLGYYTRGFAGEAEARQRNLYVGIGLNLSALLARTNWKKSATALRYIQLPYSYLPYAHELK